MALPSSAYTNLVSWTFSGNYDADRPVLIDASKPSRFLTRRTAAQLVAGLAGSFEEGANVCMHLKNDVLYPVLVLGILASKCRWVGTNPAYTQFELERALRVSRATYVVTMPEQVDVVRAAVAALDIDIKIVLFEDLLVPACSREPKGRHNGKTLPSIRDLMNSQCSNDLEAAVKDMSSNDAAMIMSTSGTSGLPKMAVRTHRAAIEETAAIEDNHTAKDYEVRRLICTPMFHAFTAPETIVNPLRLGYPTYIMQRFDATFARKVFDFQITETVAPPPMLVSLQQKTEHHHLLQSLRLIFSGGAPLAAEQRDRTLEVFQLPPRIVQVWGMTEGGWFTTFKYPEDDATGSVGRPIPGYEVKMSTNNRVDNNRVDLPDGRQTGELLVKSSQPMTGYLGNAEATAEAFTSDGWLRTGDIGYVEDGKVYLIDRAKDLIKVNGWQVAPAEIEAALAKCPLVQDAAAIGVGKGTDEHPMVLAVARDDGVIASQVREFLNSYLARYKVARVEVEFVTSIPRSAVGKILRKVLRERVEMGAFGMLMA